MKNFTILFITITMIFFFSACDNQESTSKSIKPSKNFMEVGSKKKQTPPPQKFNKIEMRIREEFELLSKEELPIKEVTQREIKDATLQLYVEAVPNNDSETMWTKGNDPRSKKYQRENENVRAVCLGIENDNYVFLTLRYFVDCTYPNYSIQKLEELPKRSLKPVLKANSSFVNYTKMLRIILSDVRHTGGGQIKIKKTTPFLVKNDYQLEQLSSYDFISGYSTINNIKYKDPIKDKLTAKDIQLMDKAFYNKKVAILQTFGNHDICLIKTPIKLWEGAKLVNLGLKYPTETIRLMTENQKILYGFEFVLLSKEAYKAVMQYKVPSQGSGIYQLLIMATAVMAPQHVVQIKLIDKLLFRVFKKSKKIVSLTTLSKSELGLLGLDFARHFLSLRMGKKLKNFMK